MLTYSLTYIIRCTMHFWESMGSCITLSLTSKLPLNDEARIILSCLLPTCWLHIMVLMLLLHLFQRFQAYFICRPLQVSPQIGRLPIANSGLLCLDFTDPLERGSHHCSIYLGSALNSEAPHLFGSSSCHKLQRFHANLFQASSACQQQYSTAYTPLNTNTIQNTSLPTKCLHRADLQYNYFLVPIIETLKDMYKFHPDALLHYI